MMKAKLNRNLSVSEFDDYYYLKEELVAFCRRENLKVSGNKNELEDRIRHYLKTGEKLSGEKIIKNSNNHQVITLNSKIGDNFVCSQDARKFFEEKIGSKFKFKVLFQKWLKDNPDKTFADAILVYENISNNQKNKDITIGKQFKYNQYIQDFFKNNPNLSLKHAVKCWNHKKTLRGSFEYEDSDLKFLEL